MKLHSKQRNRERKTTEGKTYWKFCNGRDNPIHTRYLRIYSGNAFAYYGLEQTQQEERGRA